MFETFGRYQLLKRLATGGMAQIYLAKQVGLEGFEKLLVVKRILPHLSENDDFITMFLDEARIAARLNHPNVVQIFDLGAQDESYFIAMEYIHGEDIKRVQKRAEASGRPLPLGLICRMICDAAAGLDYAHKKADNGRPLNIVHRDISPQNILVSFDGAVKVVDFGIAKAADQATVTKSGVLKGKYSYMSPEQAAGKPLDARSDIFALGVVFYELLTNTRLFKRSTDVATLNAVAECAVPPPSQANSDISAQLDDIVLKSLAREREQRYPDARALQEALESFLLQNSIPSSTLLLGSFMQEVYAERLAREANEGRLNVLAADSGVRPGEEVGSGEAKRAAKVSSSRPGTAPTRAEKRGSKSNPGEVPPALEPANASAPAPTGWGGEAFVTGSSPSAGPSPTTVEPFAPTRDNSVPSMHTVQSLPTKSRVGPLLGALAVIGLAVASAAWFWPKRQGRLEVVVEPVGALVSVKGSSATCRAPCVVPVAQPGPVELIIENPGYEAAVRQAEVPSTGQRTLTLALLPLSSPSPRADAGLEGAKVEVTFVSEPPGAALFVDDQGLGPTPQRLRLEGDDDVSVRLELEGYLPVTERLHLTEQAEQLHRYTLKKRDDRKPRPLPGEVPEEMRGKGKVRFVVTPWANVECPPNYRFGATPFGDVEMKAGEYRCVFTHPELGKQTRSVRVEADTLVKVPVNLSGR